MVSCYKATIIGLGRIGSSYPSSHIPRTHMGAYSENKRIEVVSGVDSNHHARKEFLQKWGNHIPVYSTVKEMLSEQQPDIVSVCVSPPSLTDIVSEFMQNPPKLYFLEKPVIINPGMSEALLRAVNNVPAAVNYHRCWDPAHINYFEKVLESESIVSIRVIYGKGLFNYASHIIALLVRYFGHVKTVSNMPMHTYNNDNNDPSLSFILEFNCGVNAVFQGFDGIAYDLLELEVMTTAGLFSLKSGGCRRRQELPKSSAFYPNYTQLVDVPYSIPDGQVEGLTQAVDNIVNYLDGIDKELFCNLSLSLEVFDVMWRVKESFSSEKI